MLPLLLLLLLHFTPAARGLRTCAAKSPAPTGLICGEAGSLSRPIIAVQLNGQPLHVDFENCVKIATQPLFVSGSYPASFSYDAGTSDCLIYSNPVDQQGFTPDPQSSVKFWNKHCYHCQNTCPEPSAQEVFLNGGFEWSNVSIYPYESNTGGGMVSPGHNSHYAFGCDTSGLSSCYITSEFFLCPTNVYRLSFDYKALVKPRDQSFISVTIGDDSLSVGSFDPADNGVWKTATASFQRDAEYGKHLSEIGIEFDAFGPSANFQFDNLRAEALPYPIPVRAGAPNLVKNGGFETGSLAPWVKGGQGNVQAQTTLVNRGFESNYSVQIHPARYHTEYQAYITQEVATVPGQGYVYRLVYLNTTPPNQSLRFLSAAPAVNDSLTSNIWAIFEPLHQLPGGWHAFERYFVAEGAVTTVHVELEENGLVDNVSVREAAV